MSDVPGITELIAVSARELGRSEYTGAQIEAALGAAWGVDSQLIADGTCFVAEFGAQFVACGGWSRRKTLFGGDQTAARNPEWLDPACDAARIRAFFVHPDWARKGLGRALLKRCEHELLAAGFRAAELVATLPGEKFYCALCFETGAAFDHLLPSEIKIRFVPMRKRFHP